MITQEMEQKQDLDQALKRNLDHNPKVLIRITWVTDLVTEILLYRKHRRAQTMK